MIETQNEQISSDFSKVDFLSIEFEKMQEELTKEIENCTKIDTVRLKAFLLTKNVGMDY